MITLKSVSVLLITSLMLSFAGCTAFTETFDGSKQATSENPSDDLPVKIEDKWHVIESDEIKYYFSVSDFGKDEAQALFTDANALTADICQWLELQAYDVIGVDGSKASCYFDSGYRDTNGEKRSYADWALRKIWCVQAADFAHEYVHLITGCSDRLVYLPETILIEGLATFIEFTWQDTLASGEYNALPKAQRIISIDPVEREILERMLTEAKLDRSPLNVYRVSVAYLCRRFGVEAVLGIKDNGSDYYDYYLGCVLVDYLISRPEGKEGVMTLYFDALQGEALYGASLETLLITALEDCSDRFNK